MQNFILQSNKVHELTSQAEVADRQAIRRDEKMNDLAEKVERSILREAALRAELKEAECRCADLETKVSFSVK